MPHRGRPNASRLVPHTVRALAEVTGIDLDRALRRALTGDRRARLRPLGRRAPGQGSATATGGGVDRRATLGTVGRLIAVVLFIAVLVPGVLLAPGLVAGRRPPGGGRRLGRARPSRRRRARRRCSGRRSTAGGCGGSGFLLGIAGVIGSVVLFAEASVFLWVPVLVVGLLAGVLLAEVTRPRPRWKTAVPPRRPRQGEQISRLAGLDDARPPSPPSWSLAVALWRDGDLADGVACGRARRPAGRVAAGRGGAAAGAAASAAGRGRRRAGRRGAAHLDGAPGHRRRHACSALLPLGRAAAGRAAIDLATGCPRALDLLPVALVAGGFSALAAGLAVAGFLLTWLRPVRANARALAG